MIEKALVGGLATYTNEIENYPGFPEGSTGLGLMELFHKQAKKFGVKFKLTDVRAVQLEGDTKVVETFRTNYECRSVIICLLYTSHLRFIGHLAVASVLPCRSPVFVLPPR